MAEVYYTDLKAEKESKNQLNKLRRLMRRAGIDSIFGKGDLVAVKTHFGEPGNTTVIRPQYINEVCETVIRKGAKPFVTDANTLYRGNRSNAVDHTTAAVRHGFTYPVVNAPVIIADGLTGKDQVEVEVGLRHCSTVKIGSAAHYADSIIVVSHFKGHIMTGFGGALKNVGMGFGSRAGKLEMHRDVHPVVKEEVCKGCGICADYCPTGAIAVEEVASIDAGRCIGCGECVVSCPNDAVDPGEWSDTSLLQEKIVEYCYGILKAKVGRMGYINLVMDVTPLCDCPPWSDRPIVPDIGIVASKDIVAIDQACVDLVNAERGIEGTMKRACLDPGCDKFRAVNDIDWSVQLEYAEELGLGEREYRLKRI
jgi:uncharacterized Fe-S center protein